MTRDQRGGDLVADKARLRAPRHPRTSWWASGANPDRVLALRDRDGPSSRTRMLNHLEATLPSSRGTSALPTQLDVAS
jgi:hypothetical protein